MRQYGELEYIFGVFKIIFICVLIFFNVILSALQLVPHGVNFWTWNIPYGFATEAHVLRVDANNQPTQVLDGDGGRFVALWAAITTVMFSMIGFETIAVSGPENKDLEKFETIN